MSIQLRRIVFIVLIAGVSVSLGLMIGATVLVNRAAKNRTYSNVELIPHRHVGLVLGCAKNLPDGQPNRFYRYRIAAAAALYRGRKVDYLIVSGESHPDGYNEARDMKVSLVASGVPSNAIYCDSNGVRTLDSIVRAKEIFGQSEITVISQKAHNQRAIFIAKHHGMDLIGFNAADVDGYGGFGARYREQFAKVNAMFDVFLLRTRPRSLGSKVAIGN